MSEWNNQHSGFLVDGGLKNIKNSIKQMKMFLNMPSYVIRIYTSVNI